MNRKYITTIIVASMLTAAGCSDKKSTDGTFWGSTGNPASDSIVNAIDAAYASMESPDIIDSLISVLESLDNTSGQSKARTMYNRARYYQQQGADTSRYSALYANALELTDSSRYPYDYARIKLQQALMSQDPQYTYRTSLECRKTFESVNDVFNMAVVDSHCGFLLTKASDEERSLDLYRSSANLYKTAGAEKYEFLQLYNLAITLYNIGKKEEASKVFEELRDKMPGEFEDIKVMIRLSLYECTGNVEYLFDAWNRVNSEGRYAPWQKSVVAAYITDYYLKSGDKEKAISYGTIMRDATIERFKDARDGLLLRVDKELSIAEGDSSQIASATKIYDDYLHSKATTREAVAVSAAAWKEKIEEYDDQYNQSTGKSQAIKVSVLAGIIIIVIAAALLAYRAVIKRRRIDREEYEKNLESQRKALVVAELKTQEKETALSTLLDQLDKMKEAGGYINTAMIGAKVHANMSSESEWEKFTLLFNQLHPKFYERLLADFHNLTNGELRLASMIAIGLDTKHIARLLAINPDSVKKNRQRLRSKLKLSPEKSLEQFLKNKLS